MAVVTATLDANDETCGPLKVQMGEQADVDMVITGTITVALQRKAPGGSTFVTVKKADGTTAATYTASEPVAITSPGIYQLLASGVSGGSAVCRMNTYIKVAGL